MSIDEIKTAIESLPDEYYIELRQWFSEKEWQNWDAQIERDSKSGKLDFLLKEAFKKAQTDNFYGTDESSLIEYLGREVKVVLGSEFNIKITRSEDLVLGERIAALVKTNGPETRSESLS